MSRSLTIIAGLGIILLSLGFTTIPTLLNGFGGARKVMLPEPHIDPQGTCYLVPDRIPAARAKELLREQQILFQTLRVGNDAVGGELYRNLLRQYPEAVSLRFEYLRFLLRKDALPQARAYYSLVKEDLPHDRRTLLFRNALVALTAAESAHEREDIQDALSSRLRELPLICEAHTNEGMARLR